MSSETSKYHAEALDLLETPFGPVTGGLTWADLGFCVLASGDAQQANEFFQKGLTTPTAYMYLARPLLLAGSAFVALGGRGHRGCPKPGSGGSGIHRVQVYAASIPPDVSSQRASKSGFRRSQRSAGKLQPGRGVGFTDDHAALDVESPSRSSSSFGRHGQAGRIGRQTQRGHGHVERDGRAIRGPGNEVDVPRGRNQSARLTLDLPGIRDVPVGQTG